MCGTHPMTTQRPEGAGGPFSYWDNAIGRAERRGDAALADRLRDARARINNAFLPEKVYIATNAARVMNAMLAVVKR